MLRKMMLNAMGIHGEKEWLYYEILDSTKWEVLDIGDYLCTIQHKKYSKIKLNISSSKFGFGGFGVRLKGSSMLGRLFHSPVKRLMKNLDANFGDTINTDLKRYKKPSK